MKVTVGGVDIAYRDDGRHDRPCILLVHGFPLDSRMWTAQIAALSAEYRVISPDLRGYGASGVPGGTLTMEQHADDLAGVLDHLGIRQAVVAGLSMGGYVVFAMWRRHRERVSALAFLDTRAEPDSPAARENRSALIEKVRSAGVRPVAEEMLPRLFSRTGQEDDEMRGRVLEMMLSQPAAGVIGALEGLRDRADSRPDLPGIDAPVLVLCGEEDVITPPADMTVLAQSIAGSELVLVPRTGHLTPMENPEAVNAALSRLLARSTG